MSILKQEQNVQRKVYLLLTKFPDKGTKVIKALTGLEYPHASIGLEEDMNTFYSFVTKGFIVEDIKRYTKPGRKTIPCQLYEMHVSEETYFEIKQVLSYFIEFKDMFYYSKKKSCYEYFKVTVQNQSFRFFLFAVCGIYTSEKQS